MACPFWFSEALNSVNPKLPTQNKWLDITENVVPNENKVLGTHHASYFSGGGV